MRCGIVEAVNPSRGMVAIATEYDGFTIIELISEWDLEIGDAISWENGYGMGCEIYEDRTKASREEVYVQNHGVNHASLRQQLLL
jgi:hypothetical protein